MHHPQAANDHRQAGHTSPDRRAANNAHPPTDDALRNLLVRRALAQKERRFTGEPLTGFGALA